MSATLYKLYLRSIFLLIFTVFITVDYLHKTTFISTIVNFRLFNTFSIFHLFWFYLMFEMLEVLIPKLNKYTFSGKHLAKHFIQVPKFNLDKLIAFSRQNGIKAIRSAIFWILFNTPIFIIYFFGMIDQIFIYWLFFFYYFFDTFSINVFCIFHLFVTRNKCCTECRIYNWGHFMYCTPLLLIPNFWNYSLIFISIIILIQWEVAVYQHPERFSPVSNQNLQCNYCPHICRYNVNKITLFKQLKKLRKVKKESD